MIIAFYSRRCFNYAFAVAKWIIASSTLGLTSYFLISLIKSKDTEGEILKPQIVSNLDLNKMLTGPLGLYEGKRSALALALEQKLFFFIQNIRPDLGKGERIFRIGIKDSESQKVVNEGESIFFNLIQKPDGEIEKIEFSSQGRELIPHILDGNALILKGQDASGQELEVFLNPSPERQAFSPSIDFFTQYQAKWWGNDLFFREYGGSEYKPLGMKHKIELKSGDKGYFLFVGPKDCLALKEGKWHVLGKLQEADPKLPLAVVQSISQNELEIEGWDEQGNPLFQARLEKENPSSMKFSPESSIMAPKIRGKQVSCKIGKKRMVLKPSDWVVKTQTGWRKLIGIYDIEAYLNGDLREELFVVDAIEESGQLKGRHFDQMRVHVKPFIIQAALSKAKSTKKKKK